MRGVAAVITSCSPSSEDTQRFRRTAWVSGLRAGSTRPCLRRSPARNTLPTAAAWLCRAILRIDAGPGLYELLHRRERAGADGVVQRSGIGIEADIRCVGIGTKRKGNVDRVQPAVVSRCCQGLLFLFS